jgi:oligoendopeptidase F
MSNRIIKRKPRLFIPETFEITDWQNLAPWFEKLLNQKIENVKDFENWLHAKSELESYVSENMAWRYIKMTCDTGDSVAKENFEYFVKEIQPQLAAVSDALNKKTLSLFDQFSPEAPAYQILIRSLKKAVEIFREENIPLETEIQSKQSEYQAIMGAMTINVNGSEITMPKAATYLQQLDRSIREDVWKKIIARRQLDTDKLNGIFNDLVKLRTQVAHNAGFSNFRDYMFAAMGRFDYGPADCFAFHDSVSKSLVPMLDDLMQTRSAKLGLSPLKPWDLAVDVNLQKPLEPFQTGDELLQKTERCFTAINPNLTEYIKTMREMGHFDVSSRKGKAPGGYNYPLEEIGVPFIFMNATNTLRDVVTMVHEGGHAIHSFEVRDLAINSFRNPTMEVAELASMSMELISMEHWNAFFENEEELKRAKILHLTDILSTLPWIMTVDKFQHWIYENPNHTVAEREENWLRIYQEFSDKTVDWSGFEDAKASIWHKQLHIFEVPFYYIEYGMAQLGAISVWRNYKSNPEKGLADYIKALQLGYTKTIGEIYKTANIKFDFSEKYIADLMTFVKNELAELNKD